MKLNSAKEAQTPGNTDSNWWSPVSKWLLYIAISVMLLPAGLKVIFGDHTLPYISLVVSGVWLCHQLLYDSDGPRCTRPRLLQPHHPGRDEDVDSSLYHSRVILDEMKM